MPDRCTATTHQGRRCRLRRPHEQHRWWAPSVPGSAITWPEPPAPDLCTNCGRWPRMLLVDHDWCAICVGLTPVRPQYRHLLLGRSPAACR